jgi:aspartyl-tRNA(Asn)/glutamyl-tRNA(Gln) amidotransferase subunit C
MRIDREQVIHAARLARLGITEDEVELFGNQISAILEAMDVLRELDTEGVEPTAQVTGLENVMRDDAVRPSLPREQVLANAPRREDGYFRVQAVFEEHP